MTAGLGDFCINKAIFYLEPEVPSLLKRSTNAIDVNFQELTGGTKPLFTKLRAKGQAETNTTEVAVTKRICVGLKV